MGEGRLGGAEGLEAGAGFASGPDPSPGRQRPRGRGGKPAPGWVGLMRSEGTRRRGIRPGLGRGVGP